LKIQDFTAFEKTELKQPSYRRVTEAPRKESYSQPYGTQGKMIDAVLIAEKLGCPINRMATIRTEILKGLTIEGVFLGTHEADAIKRFLELARHWHNRRGIPYAHIFAREYASTVGEHLHYGYHCTGKHDEDFCRQLSAWTGEKVASRQTRKKGETAISEDKNWQVKNCLRHGNSGVDMAIYLSKDEPCEVIGAWGDKPNNKKRVFRHTVTPGRIEGLSHHAYRHGVSRNIAPKSEAGRKILATTSDEDRKIGAFNDLPY
jgi:hypothetical protein